MITVTSNHVNVQRAFDHLKQHHLFDPAEYDANGQLLQLAALPSDDQLSAAILAEGREEIRRVHQVTKNKTFHKSAKEVCSVNSQESVVDTTVSSVRKVTEVAAKPTTFGKRKPGVWEPLKSVVAAETYRVAPEEYSLGDAEKQVEMVPVLKAVYAGPVVTVIRRPLLFWLESINAMTPQAAQLECQTAHAGDLLTALEQALINENGLIAEAADELEQIGYRLSFNRQTNTLLLDLNSGTIRWSE